MKPRILFVLQYHPVRFTGGAEMQAWMLARELVKRGWDVHYASELETEPSPAVVEGVRLHALPARYPWYASQRPALRSLLQELSPDVAFTTTFIPYVDWVCREAPSSTLVIWLMASRYDGRAWPYLIQGWQTQSLGQFLRRMPVQLYRNWLVRRGRASAGLVLAQHADQQRDLARQGIASIVWRNSHPPVSEELVQQHEGRPRVLWADSIKRLKRPEVFLDLVRRCRDLPADFVMLGRVWDSYYQRQIADVEREVPTFRYGGFIPSDQIISEFSRAHLHVKTSVPIEGFPNTFVQSWICGVPVVSKAGDPERLIETRGLGLVVRDADSLERAVRRLLGDRDERRRFGRQAREFAVREFSLEHNATLFERMLAERGVRIP